MRQDFPPSGHLNFNQLFSHLHVPFVKKVPCRQPVQVTKKTDQPSSILSELSTKVKFIEERLLLIFFISDIQIKTLITPGTF